jgi:hypothetical protein
MNKLPDINSLRSRSVEVGLCPLNPPEWGI